MVYLVSDYKVWVKSWPWSTHDGNEHGEGCEDEIHVEDEWDEEGEKMNDQPGEITRFPFSWSFIVNILQNTSSFKQY